MPASLRRVADRPASPQTASARAAETASVGNRDAAIKPDPKTAADGTNGDAEGPDDPGMLEGLLDVPRDEDRDDATANIDVPFAFVADHVEDDADAPPMEMAYTLGTIPDENGTDDSTAEELDIGALPPQPAAEGDTDEAPIGLEQLLSPQALPPLDDDGDTPFEVDLGQPSSLGKGLGVASAALSQRKRLLEVTTDACCVVASGGQLFLAGRRLERVLDSGDRQLVSKLPSTAQQLLVDDDQMVWVVCRAGEVLRVDPTNGESHQLALAAPQRHLGAPSLFLAKDGLTLACTDGRHFLLGPHDELREQQPPPELVCLGQPTAEHGLLHRDGHFVLRRIADGHESTLPPLRGVSSCRLLSCGQSAAILARSSDVLTTTGAGLCHWALDDELLAATLDQLETPCLWLGVVEQEGRGAIIELDVSAMTSRCVYLSRDTVDADQPSALSLDRAGQRLLALLGGTLSVLELR